MEPSDGIVFIFPLMMLSVSGLFVLLARFKFASSREWALGFGICALAFLSTELPFSPVHMAFVSDCLFAVGHYFYGEAIIRHFAIPPMRRIRIGLVAGYIPLAAFVVYGLGSKQVDSLLNDAVTATLLGLAVAGAAKQARHPADRALVISGGLVVLDALLRVLVFGFFIHAIGSFSDNAASIYDVAMQMSVGILGLFFVISALGSVIIPVFTRYRDAAERDHLTGLFNRRGFEDKVAELQQAGPLSGAIIACDIDHFKRVNDVYGHEAGDKVIAALAQVIAQRLPERALKARFGGEEFICYLPGASLAEGGVIAQTIRLHFANRKWRQIGIDRQITSSFGVAVVKAGEASLKPALYRADSSLYEAKQGGRNMVVLDQATSDPDGESDAASGGGGHPAPDADRLSA